MEMEGEEAAIKEEVNGTADNKMEQKCETVQDIKMESDVTESNVMKNVSNNVADVSYSEKGRNKRLRKSNVLEDVDKKFLLEQYVAECQKSLNLQLQNRVSQLEREMKEMEKAAEEKDKIHVETLALAETHQREAILVQLEKLMEELNCSICNEVFIEPTVLMCGHTYCSYCINRALLTDYLCPICRTGYNFNSPAKNVEMRNFINKLFQMFPEEARASREQVIQERAALPPPEAHANDDTRLARERLERRTRRISDSFFDDVDFLTADDARTVRSLNISDDSDSDSVVSLFEIIRPPSHFSPSPTPRLTSPPRAVRRYHRRSRTRSRSPERRVTDPDLDYLTSDAVFQTSRTPDLLPSSLHSWNPPTWLSGRRRPRSFTSRLTQRLTSAGSGRHGSSSSVPARRGGNANENSVVAVRLESDTSFRSSRSPRRLSAVRWGPNRNRSVASTSPRSRVRFPVPRVPRHSIPHHCDVSPSSSTAIQQAEPLQHDHSYTNSGVQNSQTTDGTATVSPNFSDYRVMQRDSSPTPSDSSPIATSSAQSRRSQAQATEASSLERSLQETMQEMRNIIGRNNGTSSTMNSRSSPTRHSHSSTTGNIRPPVLRVHLTRCRETDSIGGNQNRNNNEASPSGSASDSISSTAATIGTNSNTASPFPFYADDSSVAGGGSGSESAIERSEQRLLALRRFVDELHSYGGSNSSRSDPPSSSRNSNSARRRHANNSRFADLHFDGFID